MTLLEWWRIKKGWTVEFLAEESGVGRATICRLERGDSKGQLRTLGLLAHALRIPPPHSALRMLTAPVVKYTPGRGEPPDCDRT